MNETLFHTELNEFCRKYLVEDEKTRTRSGAAFVNEEKHMSSSIFEQLLLFDSVSFKVHGENIPLALLLNKFGVKGFESLLEQDAIKFVLWNQMISYLVPDIPGVDPLQYGTYSSKPHVDPEESIRLGFNWMAHPPDRSVRRTLIRKVRDVYSLPGLDLSKKSVSLVASAYRSGKLSVYGLGPESGEYASLNSANRQRLSQCAEELLQYCHLLDTGMTTYDNFAFYQMFIESGRKIRVGATVAQEFQELRELQGIPDLKVLYAELDKPFEKLLSVRSKDRSTKFRRWLAEHAESENAGDISREYIEAIANAKGFFQTKKGRLTKSVAMATIGMGMGALVAGPVGSAAGATAARFLEPFADVGLDLVDEFIISGLTKGWTPKMFFDDLEKLRKDPSGGKAN